MTQQEALGYCAECRVSSKHRETLCLDVNLLGESLTGEHDAQRSCTTAISSSRLGTL
jgi:hypothetical protein